MGEVRVTSKGDNAHFETLKMLNEGRTITEIANKRKVSRKSVHKVLSTAIKKGTVRRISKGVYEITQKGREGLHSFVGLRYQFRQHNLAIKIKIQESSKNWHLKRNEIRQLPYFNKTLKMKNNEQDLFNYGQLMIRTTTKSIIIKLPNLFAKDWEGAMVQAMGILEESIPKVEALFKVSLIKHYKANMVIISQEYAKVQDALAKLYRSEGNRLYVSGMDGKIWMITDFSFSTDETEFIDGIRVTDDVDAIAPFLNDLRDNPTTMTEMKEHVRELQGAITSYAQNEVKHQRVLDEILTTFKKLNERLDKAGL